MAALHINLLGGFEAQARSSLRQALPELRKALGGADDSLLIADRDGVSLGRGG